MHHHLQLLQMSLLPLLVDLEAQGPMHSSADSRGLAIVILFCSVYILLDGAQLHNNLHNKVEILIESVGLSVCCGQKNSSKNRQL